MTPNKYKINGCHDGDTLYLDLQLMGTLWLVGEKMRVSGVNCPELSSVEGVAAKEFAANWIASNKYTLELKPIRDKYGRLLGDLYSVTGEKLSTALLAAGHAVAYREMDE